jgi:transposase
MFSHDVVALLRPASCSPVHRLGRGDNFSDTEGLFVSYLMKEQLRDIFRTKGALATYMLDAWLEWVEGSTNKPFKKVARAIRANREGIECALLYSLSNARVESLNTKLRLLTRLAFGFHSHEPLVALAMLKLGGLCPPLPTAK